jgi:hypothetical protein
VLFGTRRGLRGRLRLRTHRRFFAGRVAATSFGEGLAEDGYVRASPAGHDEPNAFGLYDYVRQRVASDNRLLAQPLRRCANGSAWTAGYQAGRVAAAILRVVNHKDSAPRAAAASPGADSGSEWRGCLPLSAHSAQKPKSDIAAYLRATRLAPERVTRASLGCADSRLGLLALKQVRRDSV